MEEQYKKVLNKWVKNFEKEVNTKTYGVKIELKKNSQSYASMPEVTWTNYVVDEGVEKEFPPMTLKEALDYSDTHKLATRFDEEFRSLWYLLSDLDPDGEELQLASGLNFYIINTRTFEAAKIRRLSNWQQIVLFIVHKGAEQGEKPDTEVINQENSNQVKEWWNQAKEEDVIEPLTEIMYFNN